MSIAFYIMWGFSLLIACIFTEGLFSMTKASDRLAASLGDLEATASDIATALAAATLEESENMLNSAADRVDAVTKSLNTALVPPAAE